MRTKGLPLTQQAVGGAHRDPRQIRCLLSVNSITFYLQDKEGNFKGFPVHGRLLGRLAGSRALWGGEHWEGKNPS